ncbi:hypothetical protein [Streptomyces sp. CB02959]|nr:hypothetical protein [Streptomyces sp. CB02959]
MKGEIAEQQAADALAQQRIESARQAAEAAEDARQQAAALRGEAQ